MRWFRRRDAGAQQADDGAQQADDGGQKAEEGAQKANGVSIDELINGHARAGSWPELVRELDAIDPATLDEDTSIGWYQGRGVAAERQGKQEEALEVYQ